MTTRHDRVRSRVEELLVACIPAVGVDGSGMSLVATAGVREPFYGSDAVAVALEGLQLALGEGPCVDASTTGSPVMIPDLGDLTDEISGRWPVFAHEAAGSDVRAVFAFPLRIGAISLGAVDLYRRSPGPLGREALARALSTVDAIVLTLLDGNGTFGPGPGTEPLTDMAVHRAAGMVMEQLGTGIEEAFMRLRATAYSEGVPIGELANQVVAGDRRFEEDER